MLPVFVMEGSALLLSCQPELSRPKTHSPCACRAEQSHALSGPCKSTCGTGDKCICRWLDSSALERLVRKEMQHLLMKIVSQDWKAGHDLDSQRKSLEDVRCLSYDLMSIV